jgi:hypothetical protein
MTAALAIGETPGHDFYEQAPWSYVSQLSTLENHFQYTRHVFMPLIINMLHFTLALTRAPLSGGKMSNINTRQQFK